LLDRVEEGAKDPFLPFCNYQMNTEKNIATQSPSIGGMFKSKKKTIWSNDDFVHFYNGANAQKLTLFLKFA